MAKRLVKMKRVLMTFKDKKVKMLEDELYQLKRIIYNLPGSIYWKNINGVYLGRNYYAAQLMYDLGLEKKVDVDAVIGKTDFDIFDEKTATQYRLADEDVIKSKRIFVNEELLQLPDGRIIHHLSMKRPLLNDKDQVIGILGNSVDITAQKEAERLSLENEAHKTQIQEQRKFRSVVDQVAHDIRSPLASLLMLVKSCSELPEAERIAFREIAMTIEDIANNLLNQYKARDNELDSEVEARASILVSVLLLQVLTDKKYQYKDQAIKFDHDFTQDGNFAFIKIGATDLKRSTSNIINNAVDAFEGAEGKIIVKLDATKEWVKITIQDNGKGMSPELVVKIMKNMSVTEGKKDGHGIGLTQVRETIRSNQGELSIDSVVGKGTKVTLIFPRIRAPSWIAEAIKLGKDDIVIVLDDDSSIHIAWDTHFEKILQEAPGIKLKHFQDGKKALEFINSLTPQDKEKIFLLTDYELLKQELNGLHVVEQGEIKRSVLVTSHYANTVVREHAAKTGTKILPKQLASEVPIVIDETIKYSKKQGAELKHVDLIVIDDDERYVRNMMDSALIDLTVDHYTSPEHFLTVAAQYPKDTKICLDLNFNDSRMDGFYLAEQLNKLGYTRLFMISGEEFGRKKLPKYLTILNKYRIEEVKKY